jgi:hypothetical protein
MQLIVDASVLVGELLCKAGRERLRYREPLARTTAPDGPRALELLIPEHTWSETQHGYQKRITRLSPHKSLLESEPKALLEVGLGVVKAHVQIVPHPAYAPLEDEAR